MKELIYIFLLLSAFKVTACVCTCIETEFSIEDYQSADLIIKGKALDVIIDKNSQDKIITFEIYKLYKGGLSKVIKIRTNADGAMCGLGVNNQDKWLLFVHKEGGEYIVHLCDYNTRYNKRPNQSRKDRIQKRKTIKNYIKKIKTYKAI